MSEIANSFSPTGRERAGSTPAPAARQGRAVGLGSESLRAVLKAASSPGAIVAVADTGASVAGVSTAAFAACAALLDMNSCFWLSTDMRRNAALLARLRFQCGATGGVHSSEAAFALLGAGEWDGPDRFRYGNPNTPHTSTTVIIEVEGLRETDGVLVQCDECDTARRLGVRGLDAMFWRDVNRNHERAPYGLDFLLTWQNRLVALTRGCFVTLA